MLAVLGPLGAPELIIILVVVVLIFGVGKMADVGGALGKSIREFRKAAREGDDAEDTPAQNASSDAPEAAQSVSHCTKCGNRVDGQSKFCASCGAPVQAAVN